MSPARPVKPSPAKSDSTTKAAPRPKRAEAAPDAPWAAPSKAMAPETPTPKHGSLGAIPPQPAPPRPAATPAAAPIPAPAAKPEPLDFVEVGASGRTAALPTAASSRPRSQAPPPSPPTRPAPLAARPGVPSRRGTPPPAARTPPRRIEGAVTAMPPVPAGYRQVELTPIVPDRAWVRMLQSESDHSYLYDVIEPVLDNDEREVLRFLRDTLIRTLDGRKALQVDGEWSEVLLGAARQAVLDHAVRLDGTSLARIEYHLLRDFLGYGPVDVLLRDGMLEDISCDGPRIPLYIFHRKFESLRTTVQFDNEQELDAFVVRLAQRSGKHISVAQPLLDATLPDGSRLQATLSREVTTRGSSFTIRKFRADPMTPPDLLRVGTISPEMAAYFWFVMEMGSSFLLAGGTASGKTTTLNAVSQFIPPEKKIVSIEDTREINLVHENWIAGLTRSGFGDEVVSGKAAGTIDMYKLLESALRQRPEYLIVGEVRGPEALTLFQAMATGHAVYSTMHADSVQSAVYRLENAPINIPRIMIQTLDLMGIQGQVRIGGKLARRILNVTEFAGYDPDTKELLTNTVFEWDVKQDRHRYLGRSVILEHIMERRNIPEAQLMQEWKERTEVIEWMNRTNVRHYRDVANAVSGYYRDPKAFLARVRRG